MPKISIIVPVYKSELYLNRCIDSILNQSYNDIELLLIDDGSPDLCPKICDEYAAKDKRIKVIHKTNGGVAAARNTGLEIASGEYITFVDSDDWIEPNMYQSMMEIAAHYNCDVVMCDCVKDFDDHSEIYSHDIRDGFYNSEQLKTEYYPHLLIMENIEYPATISNWLCLFKRQNNMPRYVEGVRYSEDWLFGAQMMYNADSFYYMKGESFYHYCMNPTSATHTFTIDKWNDYKKLYEKSFDYFSKCVEFDFNQQLNLMLLFLLYNAVGNIRGAARLTNHQKKQHISDILNERIIRQMFKQIKIYELPISWKLKVYTYMYKFKIGQNLLILLG